MKKANCKTTTYYTGVEDFMIDIVEHKTNACQFDTWLYRERMGIKEYIVGYMRLYNYSVPEIIDNLTTYLMIPDIDGNTWYQAYDEEYN